VAGNGIHYFYATLVWKTLPNFDDNLAISHLVHGFNDKDVCFESFVIDTLFQLAYCSNLTCQPRRCISSE
jgi:hypothetical protein